MVLPLRSLKHVETTVTLADVMSEEEEKCWIKDFISVINEVIFCLVLIRCQWFLLSLHTSWLLIAVQSRLPLNPQRSTIPLFLFFQAHQTW